MNNLQTFLERSIQLLHDNASNMTATQKQEYIRMLISEVSGQHDESEEAFEAC
jgi:hypothetical protein